MRRNASQPRCRAVAHGQTSEAAEPAEAALHRPAAPQQHEPLFGLRKFDYLKLHSSVECCLRRLLAGISLIGERHLDRLARRLLNLTRQLSDLCSPLFVGRRWAARHEANHTWTAQPTRFTGCDGPDGTVT